MSRKEVLESLCDNCGKEERTDIPKNRVFVLPPNWMHISGETNRGVQFEIDLCPECTKMVLAAAGQFPGSTNRKQGKK